MGQHTPSEVFAPLLGAAVFAGMVGYGFLTGKMPASRFGGEAGRTEMPIAFWALGALYAACSIGCLIWFVFVLLS
jgi:hypothetical protein